VSGVINLGQVGGGVASGQLAGMYNANESLTQKIARESTQRWLMAQDDEEEDDADMDTR